VTILLGRRQPRLCWILRFCKGYIRRTFLVWDKSLFSILSFNNYGLRLENTILTFFSRDFEKGALVKEEI